MKRKLAYSFGVAVLSTAGLLGAAAGANADASGETGAQATYFTLYGNDNYGGDHKGFASGNSDHDLGNNFWTGTSHIMEDEASSMTNKTGRDVALFQNPGSTCSGSVYVALRHSNDKDFSNNNFDNKASCVLFR
ncbi:peptidase inhibitor family I36 protein [Actinomycetota bacterium Odt1-20B]